jgi:endo-1,4-beta-xylanase
MTLPRAALVFLLLSLHPVDAQAQEPQPLLLWPDGAPGSEGRTAEEVVRPTELGEHIISQVHRPSITPYLPAAASATGAAVIIIPGGGHRELWMKPRATGWDAG